MNFYIEWALAVHRALWFPLNWALGLERPPEEIPLDINPGRRTTESAATRMLIRSRARRRPRATKLAA